MASAGFSWVLLMLQHSDHSRNRPTATYENKKRLLYFGCDFSGWQNLVKCTKFDFDPDPAGGAYSAPTDP